MRHAVKDATPSCAGREFWLQVSTAPPAGAVTVSMTETDVETTLPAVSGDAMTGWAKNDLFDAPPRGDVVKSSLVAGPAATVKLPLVPEDSPGDDAVRV